MGTILFVWELGRWMGHVSALLPLALECRQRGYHVLFVVRDTRSAELLLAAHGIGYLQAPISRHAGTSLTRPSHNYSELLLQCGYDDPVVLAGLIGGWQQLFALIRPVMAIFEHSPTALLASRGTAMKRVVLGTGFYFPPPLSPFPDFYPDAKLAPEVLQASDDLALANINAALARRCLPPLHSMTSFFDADYNFLCTFSELEHYPERGSATYWGMLFVDDVGMPILWPENCRKRIFVYLRSQNSGLSGSLNGAFERLMSQLRTVECEVFVVSPGISPQQRQRFRSPHIRFAEELHNLASLKGQCDLAILYGGIGTMSGCLLSGIPLLLLPESQEQRMAVRRVVEMGAALCVENPAANTNFGAMVRQLLDDPRYGNAAAAFARRYAGYHPRQQAGKIAELLVAGLQVPDLPVADS